jgi:predicted permease
METLTMGFRHDLRIAVRNLGKHPGFTAVALLTLALGIGANTAVFSVIRHVLIAPLPYHEPDRVVDVWSRWVGYEKTWVSDAEVVDYQTRVKSFSAAGAWSVTQVNIVGDGDPVRIGAAQITPNVLDVLGASPLIGRGFTHEDAAATPSTAVILSHALWQQRFGGDPNILSRTIDVNGRLRQIVGVMPAGFQLPTDYVVDAEEPTRIWIPYRLDPQLRGSHGLNAAARLAPGATVQSANAELATLAKTLVSEGLYPEAMHFQAFAITTTDEAVGAVRPALMLVVGAVAFLLLIACTNVANLLLVRADARTREMALRTALGASRWRVARQLVTEGAVLAAAAAVVGSAIAWAALRALVAFAGTQLPRLTDVRLDLATVAFAVGVTAVTLLLFSLVPAWRTARVDLVDSLKDGSQNASAGIGKRRLRSALVVVEMALAVAMLTGAGLMIRSVWALQHIDVGFVADRVLTMRLALPAASYDTPAKSVAFFDTLTARVRALPGVEQAGLLRLLPLGQEIGDWGLTVEGYQPPPGTGAPGDWQVAGAGGPEALGERLVQGRWLTDADTDGRENVALINESMARAYWSDRPALGGRFKMGNAPQSPWITVVGIVGNVRHNGLEAPIKPKFYRPYGQFHQSTGSPSRNLTLVVKTAGDPLALAPSVRAVIRDLDPSLPVAAVRSMDDVVAHAIATPRLTSWLLTVFAALALTLAAVGIYGVLAYVVAQRRQEIGIRMAIGADRARVLGLVMRGGLWLAAAGLAVGLGLSAALARFIQGQLHDVTPFDPATFVAVSLLLLFVAAVACFLPALRATRISPVTALRNE